MAAVANSHGGKEDEKPLPSVLLKLLQIADDDDEDLLKLGPYADDYSLEMVQYVIGERKKTKEAQLDICRQRKGDQGMIEWDDLDTSFTYTLHDIPVLDTTGRRIMPMQITRFEQLDDCSAIVAFPELLRLRTKLCNRITKYCQGIQPEEHYIPEVEQIIFVKIPTWTEVEAAVKFEHMFHPSKAEKWLQANRKLHNPSFEDLDSHHWTRAVVLGKLQSDDDPDHCPNALIVDLIDFGRQVPVVRQNIRRAAYRYIPFPAIGVRLCICVNAVIQYTEAVHTDWKSVLGPGTHVEVDLLVDCEFQLVVRLHRPSESEFLATIDALAVLRELEDTSVPKHICKPEIAYSVNRFPVGQIIRKCDIKPFIAGRLLKLEVDDKR